MSRRGVVFAVLSLLVCVMIFCFSAQNADESSKVSTGVIATVCRFAVDGFTDLEAGDREKMIDDLQFAVRKAAHFSIYLLLGVFALQAYLGSVRTVSLAVKSVAAWGFCIFYSVTDELHQLLVPGRSGELRDVCIDSAGALTGIALSLAVLHIIHTAARRKESKE